MMRPQVTDKTGWQQQLEEHRRILFERVVQAFPEVLKTHMGKVGEWRLRLTK
jgi:hypothetical protein